MGDFLVDHKETRFISFTGSREVGCRIYERAAKVHPGQLWLKRVVAEMGGKDAIVIADDADLEAASTAAVASGSPPRPACRPRSRSLRIDLPASGLDSPTRRGAISTSPLSSREQGIGIPKVVAYAGSANWVPGPTQWAAGPRRIAAGVPPRVEFREASRPRRHRRTGWKPPVCHVLLRSGGRVHRSRVGG